MFSSKLKTKLLWFFRHKFHVIALYCAFHKHANSKVQKTPSQLCFSLPSIIITITSNEPWNTETHKTDRNPPITNHKPWPFEPVKVKFCFLRGPLRWLTAAKNAIVCWLLNFRIRMFVKSAVNLLLKTRFLEKKKYYTATSVIQSPRYYGHSFWPPGSLSTLNWIHFLVKKTLINTVTR